MLEERNVRHDVVALLLMAAIIFAGLALGSYHRADPVGLDGTSSLVYPPAQSIGNICGRAGAWLADWLLRSLGVGAYYLLASLVALDAMLLLRRRVPQPILRLLGWLVSLIGLTTLAAMAVPSLFPKLWAGPEIGPGGVLGAAGRGLLEMNFAAAGAYILTVSLVLGGLMLSTDYLVIGAVAWCLHTPIKAAAQAGRVVTGRKTTAVKDTDASKDDDAAEEPAEKDQEVAVRILGRRIDAVTAEPDKNAKPDAAIADDAEETDEETGEADDDNEEEDEEGDEDSAEEAQPAAAEPAKPGMGQRIAAALRFRPNGRNAERDKVIEQLQAAAEPAELPEYKLPDINLLLPAEQMQFAEQEKEVRRRAKILEKTFLNFGFNIRVVEIETGPVIAQFEVELEAGLRLSKITGLADDLAIALRVPSVRIVAPIPGKNTVGIEVPNTERQLVRLREVMEEDSAKVRKMKVPIFLGKDVSGNPMTVDLSSLPHLLIAGRTGTGKSVCLNSIIVSMIMTRRPDEVRMLMIDPKMVELSPYKNLPHLMHPVVTDMRKAEAILGWAVEKMEERYALLARAGVRHVSVYNQLGEEELMERIKPESEEERESIPLHLPYIICIADEIADLMMTAPKEVEGHIIRLAQKSRAVGIHLVLATQKPTVDVITGLIKSNLPARICFQVASRVDSRVVLDEMGADKLLGNGDMLFLWPGTSTLLRGQGTYLSDDEITRVIGAVETTEPQFVKELVQLQPANASGEGEGSGNRFKNRDDLYEAAIDVIVREGRGSVSLLQRALGIGYGRGARLIDFMAEDGIVGTYNGSQAREVLITPEQWLVMQGEANGQAAAPQPALPVVPPRRNKIEVSPRRPESVDEAAESTDDEAVNDADSHSPFSRDAKRSACITDEEDDASIYGVRRPVEITDEAEEEEPEEDEESEAEEDDSEWDDDDSEEDEDESSDDESDEAETDEDEEELDEDEQDEAEEEEEDEPAATPVSQTAKRSAPAAKEIPRINPAEKPNAPQPTAGKIEKPPTVGKGRQSRSA